MVVLRAELSSCKTDFKDYKVSNIYSLALDSRSWPHPAGRKASPLRPQKKKVILP
jgi:hypothetical protein